MAVVMLAYSKTGVGCGGEKELGSKERGFEWAQGLNH